MGIQNTNFNRFQNAVSIGAGVLTDAAASVGLGLYTLKYFAQSAQPVTVQASAIATKLQIAGKTFTPSLVAGASLFATALLAQGAEKVLNAITGVQPERTIIDKQVSLAPFKENQNDFPILVRVAAPSRINKPKLGLINKAISHVGAAAAGLHLAGKVGLFTSSFPFWPSAAVGGLALATAPVVFTLVSNLYTNRSFA